MSREIAIHSDKYKIVVRYVGGQGRWRIVKDGKYVFSYHKMKDAIKYAKSIANGEKENENETRASANGDNTLTEDTANE